MSKEPEPEKTPREQFHDVISRLKEIEHYSRSNIEKLADDWFLVDDRLKLKDFAKAMEPLMTIQNQFQDTIVEMIETAEAIKFEE